MRLAFDVIPMSNTTYSCGPNLEWLPGESLFSLCSRYHQLSGHHIPAKSCRTLFGTARSGSAHDIAANLQRLVDRSQGSLGTAREIILQRTLCPFYFPFHSEQKCENWLSQMIQGTAPMFKAELGLAASGFGASHPLKACPACIESDQANFGVAYWHVHHQIPGVLMCGLHLRPLLAATDKVSGKDRFGWILPANARLVSLMRSTDKYDAAEALAVGSIGLWNLPVDFCFDHRRLEQLYRLKLIELGFFQGRYAKVNQSKFDCELGAVLMASGMADAWPWMLSQDQRPLVSQRFVRMCRATKSRQSCHPLNHLALILLLFGSLDSFWSAYNRHQVENLRDDVSDGTTPVASPSDSAVLTSRNAVLQSLRSGVAVSCAAKLHGVAVGTAMAWAASEGIESPRRPKILRNELRAQLVGLLNSGEDKQAAAMAVNVSVSTVTRVLFTELGLHERWTTARFQHAQEQARTSWLKVLRSFPNASSIAWRNLEPAAYAWLYRNDRAWLQNSIYTRPQPVQIKDRRRDWVGRDESFAQAVREAGLDWHRTHTRGHVTLAELCSSVRGLHEKLSAIHKLPLTQKAIQEVCSTKRMALDSSQYALGRES